MSGLLASGALSDLVLIDTVIQHWLLAIDRDCIAVSLSFESPPVCTTCKLLFVSQIKQWLEARGSDCYIGLSRSVDYVVIITLYIVSVLYYCKCCKLATVYQIKEIAKLIYENRML